VGLLVTDFLAYLGKTATLEVVLELLMLYTKIFKNYSVSVNFQVLQTDYSSAVVHILKYAVLVGTAHDIMADTTREAVDLKTFAEVFIH